MTDPDSHDHPDPDHPANDPEVEREPEPTVPSILDRYSPYIYQARPRRLVDGDTYDLEVDLGFGIRFSTRVRLEHVNTAETWFVRHDSDEYQNGMIQYGFVADWFAAGSADISDDDPNGNPAFPFLLGTAKDRTGARGRWIGTVVRKSDGESVSDALYREFGDDVLWTG